MGRLSADHIDVLRIAFDQPFYGFVAGSNLWSLTALECAERDIDGEVVDELLRKGLLEAKPIPTTVSGQRSSNHDIAPDLDFEHEVRITPAGRQALEADDAKEER